MTSLIKRKPMETKYKIQSRSVHFTGFDGSQLAATLDFPVEVSPSQFAIFSHCFTCTRQTLTTSRLSRGLAQVGIGVLRFDFTGLGESSGDFADTTFSSNVADLVAAADSGSPINDWQGRRLDAGRFGPTLFGQVTNLQLQMLYLRRAVKAAASMFSASSRPSTTPFRS